MATAWLSHFADFALQTLTPKEAKKHTGDTHAIDFRTGWRETRLGSRSIGNGRSKAAEGEEEEEEEEGRERDTDVRERKADPGRMCTPRRSPRECQIGGGLHVAMPRGTSPPSLGQSRRTTCY